LKHRSSDSSDHSDHWQLKISSTLHLKCSSNPTSPGKKKAKCSTDKDSPDLNQQQSLRWANESSQAVQQQPNEPSQTLEAKVQY
jgi:hypothetical protein